MSGDQDFEKFIEEDSDNPSKLPFFLMVTVREKLNSINELYRTTIENLDKIGQDDSIRIEMKDFLSKLMSAAINSIDQLNILMSSEIETGDEPEEGSEDDDEH